VYVADAGLGDKFEHSLTFDSDFESGNLHMAIQVSDAAYDLFLRADMHTAGHTQWFYFAVANTHPPALVRLAEQGVQVPPVRVRFNIVNLTKPDSLYNLGMRPVVYSRLGTSGWLCFCFMHVGFCAFSRCATVFMRNICEPLPTNVPTLLPRT
jgi:hypothetical protein